MKVRHDYFKNSFFLFAVSEWNKFYSNIRNAASINIFKKRLLNFIRHCANSIFDIHYPLRIKLLIRLCLGLNHLHEHKFRYCFQKTLNPLCDKYPVTKLLNQQWISSSTAPRHLHSSHFLTNPLSKN